MESNVTPSFLLIFDAIGRECTAYGFTRLRHDPDVPQFYSLFGGTDEACRVMWDWATSGNVRTVFLVMLDVDCRTELAIWRLRGALVHFNAPEPDAHPTRPLSMMVIEASEVTRVDDDNVTHYVWSNLDVFGQKARRNRTQGARQS